MKSCGCPPHNHDHQVGRDQLEVDGETISVATQLRCGRCGKDSTVKEPHNPEKHGPRVGNTSVESYDEYLERTRAVYAAEAAKIRADLINLVSDAMLNNDPRSVEAGADIDGLAEIAVDAVAEFFSQQQPFIETARL